MMRSMFSGVSGLRVQQTAMDVIGNNIANVNTAGYKTSRVTFSDVFSQTLQGASGANAATGTGGQNPVQIGLGTTVGSIDMLMTEGAAQRTDNPLDLKIEGEGFFVVSNGNGYKFTKAGAFRIDDAGNLVTPDGLKVMGWLTDTATNEIKMSQVQPLSILSAENAYSSPEMTTKCHIEGNINELDPQFNGGNSVPFNVGFYDSLGYRYTAELHITQAASNNYDITLSSVKDSNGDPIATAGAGSATVSFNPSTGKVDTTNPTTFSITGMTTGFSEIADPLEIDFSSLVLTSAPTSIRSYRGDVNGYEAGREPGEIAGFSVGPDGKIQGQYTNGETKLLGQIVTASFENPAGLQKAGNNLYETTLNSGEFDGIGQDPTGNGGKLNAGVLEMSNVDLSKEFSDMIITQRAFQANSRIITSSDEMLQELVNLKR